MRVTLERQNAPCRQQHPSLHLHDRIMFASVVRAAPLRASSRAMAPKLKFQPGYRIVTPETLPNFAGSAVGWGVAAAGFVTLYMSGVPKFKKDVLIHLPIVSSGLCPGPVRAPTNLRWLL